MSGQLTTRLRDMMLVDVDTVLGIEQQVHSHPWTRVNFIDALQNSYICKVYEVANEIVGYAILMPAPDDVSLLDISIASSSQHKGLGSKLLGELLALARSMKFERMILEVRVSNVAAHALYQKAEFKKIGIRRDYYPDEKGREDAIVMEHKLI